MAKAASVTSFVSALDTPLSSVERPKPAPQGTYTCLIQGQPRFDKSSKKQTPFVEFTLKYLAAGDDVDEDALAEWLTTAEGEKKKLQDQTIKATYYLTDSAMWRLKEFLEHCGAVEEDSDLSATQAIAETPGKQILVHIGHESSDDGTAVFARVKGTAPLE